MTDVVEIGLLQFSLVYILLLVVGVIMKLCRIDQLKLLSVASIRMTVQLIVAGYLLMYIFDIQNPILTVGYVLIMTIFTCYRVLSINKNINKTFKFVVCVCTALSGLSVLTYFVVVVVGESMFNPQYVIPLSGMILGNTMTGLTLGVRTFHKSVADNRIRIQALLCAGATPSTILMPFVRYALETALLPTLNSMVGMGIISLPGMMTGQILSGTPPTTAIFYQIAIMIAICATVCVACFGTLYFGHKTMYDKKTLIVG